MPTFRDRLDAALLADDPDAALRALVATAETSRAFPELPALAMRDGAGRHKDVLDHSIRVAAKTPPRLSVRMAALCHDLGKPATRRFEDDGTVTFHAHEAVGARLLRARMRSLRYPHPLTDRVCTVVEMSGRFKGFDDGDGGWTDSAVRRFATDAGDALEDLLDLCEVDVTSKHAHKHVAQRDQVGALRARLAEVADADARAAERPDLDGRAVMDHLGLAPGPAVGQILAMLLAHRRDAGRPLGDEQAWALVDAWAARNL